MPSYNWRDYRGRSWTQRFPDWSYGFVEWRAQARVDPGNVERFEAVRRRTARPLRPRVFVSHRQADVDFASRIAYLACQEGFDYWLDVLDPTLTALPGAGVQPTQQERAAAIATVIEMGLLNSTHVVAVMTQNTKGSRWVPYEYGRVKEPMPITLQAASWIASSLPTADLPEYLYLGVITKSETDLKSWLRSELRAYGASAIPCGWNQPVPAPL